MLWEHDWCEHANAGDHEKDLDDRCRKDGALLRTGNCGTEDAKHCHGSGEWCDHCEGPIGGLPFDTSTFPLSGAEGCLSVGGNSRAMRALTA